MFTLQSPGRQAQGNLSSAFAIFIFLIFNIHGLTHSMSTALKFASIEWSPHNNVFHSVGSYIGGQVAKVQLQLNDRLVFSCDPNTPSVIYRVTKDSFEKCRWDAVTSIWVGQCDIGRKMTQSIVLRPFSPIPGGPVYHPNKTYYFTSFSSGNEYGIDQHADGLCAQGMRLVVEIKSTSDSLFLGPLSTTSTTEIPQVPIERVPYSGLVAQPEARTSEMLSERKDRTIESTPYNQYNSDVLSPLRSPTTYGYVELPHMFQGEPDEKSHKMLNSGLGHGVQERARIHMRLRDPIGSRLQANVGLSSSWDTVLPDYYSYNGTSCFYTSMAFALLWIVVTVY